MRFVAAFLLSVVCVAHASWDPFLSSDVFIEEDNGRLSLYCEDVPMQTVLHALADAKHFNVVMAYPLTMPVSMNIKSVPSEKLLDILLQTYQLDYQFSEDLLTITSNKTELAEHPLQTFPLKYARAKETADMLAEQINVTFDARTNALVVRESKQSTAWLSSFLESIDVPAKQVYIEAKILNAHTSFSKELGLKFTFGEVNVSKLPDDIPIDVAISAAEKDNKTSVIANPKLLTENLQEAHIKQGKQIAYEETARSGATALKFQEAVLELKVTPMITPEHDIVLNLLVKQDMVGAIAANGQPSIDTKSIQAQVRVHDGETIVLGGIYSQVDNAQQQRLPLLGKLPLIGRLFREHKKLDDKDELLIFVTPHVVI